MHIPDGFLNAKTALATAAVSAASLGIALRLARVSLPPRRVPLMGLTAAFIFAAQMINFPVGAGTSGHLVGGVLAATLVGPAAAIVVMCAVLIIQALLFADGGVTALGANVLNMAIVGVVAGYAIYALVRRLFPGERGRIVAAAFAAWCSTVLAAGFCGIELVFSGKGWIVLPVMLGWHMLIGVGEAIITAIVLSAVARARPELLDGSSASAARAGATGIIVVAGLSLALGLAIFLSPLKSKLPDGLEKAAQTLAFAGDEKPLVNAPAADYQMRGIRSATVATALAGGIGTVVAFGLSLLLARILVPKAQPAPSPAK